MKIICSLLIAIFLISCQNSTTENTPLPEIAEDQGPGFLEKYPLMTWMRKNPAEFGCMLENGLSYKDSVFNCSYEEYINNGDPCDSTEEYYEGSAYSRFFIFKN